MSLMTIDEKSQDASRSAGNTEASLDDINRRLINSYDAKADRYDSDRSVTPSLDYFFDLSYCTINDVIGPTTESTVHLDMPVGTGRFLCYLREHGRRHQMFGIDISAGMVRICRDAVGDRVGLSIGDAFRLPLADNSVDLLTSLRMFHLFPIEYWPAAIAEMRRVLKPGGLLITEMRNMIRGVACSLLVSAYRDRRKTHPHSFVPPHRVGDLLRDWDNVRTQGIGIDGLARAQALSPALARGVRLLERRTPVRYLSKVLLIAANKPRC